MKVSSCLIVKNEAENLARYLDSIKDISDEIIVVDTGSTDNTVDIALSYDAKIYHYKWDNNFSNAKNFALDKASGDWIIFLDADEYFESNTIKQLKTVLNHVSSNKIFDAVLCKMLNIDSQTGKLISENPIMRIFKGKTGIRYVGAIHEQPLKNGKVLKAAQITDISLIIYHTGYAPSLMPQKYQRNLELLNQRIENNDIDNLTYYYLSSIHNSLKNSEEAIKYALLALNEPTLANTIVAYQPYIFLIQSMMNLKDKYTADEIEKYAEEAIIKFPDHPEIWYVRATVKKAQNDYLSAIQSYQKALECQNSFNMLMNNNFPARLEDVYFELATLYGFADDHIHELEYYFEVLKINKRNFSAFEGLYKLIKDQQPTEIILFLNSIYDKKNKGDLVFLNASFAKLGNTVLANYYFELYTAKFG